MDRRKFLLGTTGIFTALAGCTGSDSTQQETTKQTTATDTTTATPKTKPTTTSTIETTTTDPEPETTNQSDSETTTADAEYTVRVSFEGEWQGSISAGGSSKSIEGTGSESFTVTGDPFVVAANAQKESDGTEN